ncbi:MAG: globin [Gammaproteobacteria bacterium 28-57-27]|nr:MAG: globin [Gammaproteobacteria bacterium 28-57-27]
MNQVIPQITAYTKIGGEAGIHRLTARFYQLMCELPSARELLSIHRNLDDAEQKLSEFLSGWLGGPQLFMERHGHPRLRMRHMQIAVDSNMRDQWMHCMRHALDQTVEDPLFREELYQSLWSVADHMRNRLD